jgi:nitrogen-specific signal transduction histidine kinase
MIEELTLEILTAEKNAYGKVIRMMAHEVNNSIGAINSILDVTKSNQDHHPEIRNALQVAIDRNERLNQFMKNFADVIRIPGTSFGKSKCQPINTIRCRYSVF